MAYRYHGWWGPHAKRHCPHSALRGIYGDDINHIGFRLECLHCGQHLGGPVTLADMRRDEREESDWDTS